MSPTPSFRDRLARRIYEATPGSENDPWDAAILRRQRLGLDGPTGAIAIAYAQADAAMSEMRHSGEQRAGTDATPGGAAPDGLSAVLPDGAP